MDHCLITWTICNFQELSKICETTASIYSPIFCINPERWVISVLPVYMHKDENVIRFNLIRNTVENIPRAILVTLRFGIKSSKTTWFEEKHKIQFPVGGENITICDIPKYPGIEDALKDDTLIVMCEMYISYYSESFRDLHNIYANPLLCLSLDILRQYETSCKSDVIIRCKNLSIRAHKAILSFRSPVFAEILKNDSPFIDIPEDDFANIHSVLLYMYTGGIDWLACPGMHIGLYECAKRYEVKRLIQLLTTSEIRMSSVVGNFATSFTWKIDKFSTYKTEVNKCITSPPFNSGFENTTSWFLDIYPEGCQRALDNIGIFVRNSDLLIVESINVCVSILDEKHRKCIQKTTNKLLYPNLVYGFPDYTTKKELLDKQLLAGDKLIISCELTHHVTLHSFDTVITSSASSYFKHPHLEELSADLEKLAFSGKFSDLCLISDEEIFNVHKVILAARSDRFKTLINESEDDVIGIAEICPEVLEAMMFYVYTGKLNTYNNRLLIGLYSAAQEYSVSSLSYSCALAMNCIDKKCINDAIGLAYRYSDKELLEQCLKYIKEHPKFLENSKIPTEVKQWIANYKNQLKDT